MRYHLSEDGEPRRCVAAPGRCRLAGDGDHFDSPEAARDAFEARNEALSGGFSRSQPHTMALSSQVEGLLSGLESENLTPYIVGGSVRDSVLSGASPKDVDIEVFGASSMDVLEKALRKQGLRVDSVGKSFGVLKVQLSSGEDIDVSLPRVDSKVGDGHRGFEVTVRPDLSMEEAAGRRDFTVNSLYYSHSERQLKDPYGGLQDYSDRQLRHINDKFSEDPLRVIRGAQFAARFKMKLAPETVKLSRNLLPEYDSLAKERIQTEFEKLLSKGDVRYGIEALQSVGWDTKVGLSDVDLDTADRATDAANRAKKSSNDPAVYAGAVLLKAVPKESRAVAAEAMITGDRRRRKAMALTEVKSPEHITQETVRKWAREIGRRGLTVEDAYLLSGDEKLKAAAQASDSFDSPQADYLTGAIVLKESGAKPGPWIGKLLSEASLRQDNGEFASSADAVSWLRNKVKSL